MPVLTSAATDRICQEKQPHQILNTCTVQLRTRSASLEIIKVIYNHSCTYEKIILLYQNHFIILLKSRIESE